MYRGTCPPVELTRSPDPQRAGRASPATTGRSAAWLSPGSEWRASGVGREGAEKVFQASYAGAIPVARPHQDQQGCCTPNRDFTTPTFLVLLRPSVTGDTNVARPRLTPTPRTACLVASNGCSPTVDVVGSVQKEGAVQLQGVEMSDEVTGEPPESKQEIANGQAADKKAVTRVERPFPRRSLEEALRVPRAIRDGNAGKPWGADQVALALKIAAKSSNLKYLLGASEDFGLTSGRSAVGQISLTDLGKEAVYPSSPDAEAKALRQAFNKVDVFRKVLEHYDGNNLPEREFLDNTLQKDFDLHPDALDEFVDLFEKNCRTAKIGKDLPDDVVPSTNGHAPTVVSTATTPKAKAGSRPVCFIIMPFTERHDDHEVGFFTEVLEQLFNPALEAAGFEPRTALQQGSDVIQATIVNALLDADMVLADLTEHNPNVLFELGMRMHTEKPVALVRAKGTGKVFDVDNMLRVVDYNPNLWPSTVKKDLPEITEHVKATWNNRGKSKTFMQILADTPAAVPV